jgi:cation transport ATPase
MKDHAGLAHAMHGGHAHHAENVKIAAASAQGAHRTSYRKMVQNLWWAAGYNVVAIPLAAGVLAPWGVLLSPATGAVLMTISTIIVAINAQLLRRAQL